MAKKPMETASYTRLGQPGVRSPLVIAVPHAGQVYPPAMMAMSRLPREALETIEDRHADLLVDTAVSSGAVAIVARIARAYVDLNRDEREFDPALLSSRGTPGDWSVTSKVTGGLGIVPSRIAAGGSVWNRALEPDEVRARVAEVHHPYHSAIAAALDQAMAVFGTAILIDCHSMPPLGGRGSPAQLVLGDRHGQSADLRFVLAAAEVAKRDGLTVARNQPYAGGYTLDRHGDPKRGRHALQIEVDRSLYLEPTHRHPGHGLARVRTLVSAIAAALAEEARGQALAAE